MHLLKIWLLRLIKWKIVTENYKSIAAYTLQPQSAGPFLSVKVFNHILMQHKMLHQRHIHKTFHVNAEAW